MDKSYNSFSLWIQTPETPGDADAANEVKKWKYFAFFFNGETFQIFSLAKQISDNIAYFLPRNADMDQVGWLHLQIRECFTGQKPEVEHLQQKPHLVWEHIWWMEDFEKLCLI